MVRTSFPQPIRIDLNFDSAASDELHHVFETVDVVNEFVAECNLEGSRLVNQLRGYESESILL